MPSDLKTDLITLHKRILRLINPNIRDKISCKGLSILLNTVVGYDSEYELNSSVKMTNSLLSVQLAGSTGVVLKVPVVNKDPVKPGLVSTAGKLGEQMLSTICCRSLDEMIKNIRNLLHKENDDLLDDLLTSLSAKDLNNETVGDYKVFIFPKSEVASLIKYTNEYKSVDLIKDSDDLNQDNHEKSLYDIIKMLNNICGGKEMSVKLSKSIQHSSNKPSSRITYRHGDSRLSLTINRILYICMHESAADLSMLNDFDEFKENLDIVGRSFVTLGKPLIVKECKSKVHIRDTVLIAPGGAKSLAGVGNIYGDEFKKIDIGHYRGGNMRLLLNENEELFKKYALQDALITLKHACSMEEFNLTVSKIGVPLTISGIGKSYVLRE